MKKLVMAVAIVCAAACANAAAFSWKTSATGKVYEAGTTTLLASATAYLFDAAVVSQSSLVTAFDAGTLNLASKTSVSSAAVASGAIATTTFNYGVAGGDYSLYLALIVDDQLFISDAVAAPGLESGTKALSLNAKAASQAAAMDASAGYSTAGWYESVPEPTSGLLLLLGMAGLALKRKQA